MPVGYAVGVFHAYRHSTFMGIVSLFTVIPSYYYVVESFVSVHHDCIAPGCGHFGTNQIYINGKELWVCDSDLEKYQRATDQSEIVTKMNTQEFTPEEHQRFLSILSLANQKDLDSNDIEELRNLLRQYHNRTGSYLSDEECEQIAGGNKLMAKYFNELGSSLLSSWDNRKEITTSGFDSLYKILSFKSLRSEEKLKRDVEYIKAAAHNQDYIELEDGSKIPVNRYWILQSNMNNDRLYNNLEIIVSTMKKFTHDKN